MSMPTISFTLSRMSLFYCFLIHRTRADVTPPINLLTKHQTECELESLTVGSILADRYNSHDEESDWDMRIHDDYMTEHLGFAGWIQMGTLNSGGKTALGMDAKTLHNRGGWAGKKLLNTSSYWALEDQWLYMMGDSTQRQIWGTFVSPFQNNDFERNAKGLSDPFSLDSYPDSFPALTSIPSTLLIKNGPEQIVPVSILTARTTRS